MDSLEEVESEVVECRACPRLVAWREQVAIDKRAAFSQETYWARPIPGFGDPGARLALVGLAPAAHGGNRTGRVFTGDRSGDWVFRALWRAGFANQPTSESLDDGLRLTGAWVTAAVRCAPPANRPTPAERDTCLPYLGRELALLTDLAVVVVLGKFAHDAVARLLGLRPRPRFAHLAEHRLHGAALGHGAGIPFGHGAGIPFGHGAGTPTLLCSYHPSQQNTFTGTLTEPAFDAVFTRARELIG